MTARALINHLKLHFRAALFVEMSLPATTSEVDSTRQGKLSGSYILCGVPRSTPKIPYWGYTNHSYAIPTFRYGTDCWRMDEKESAVSRKQPNRRTVKAGLKTLNHTWGTHEKKAKNRNKWRSFAAAPSADRHNGQYMEMLMRRPTEANKNNKN